MRPSLVLNSLLQWQRFKLVLDKSGSNIRRVTGQAEFLWFSSVHQTGYYFEVKKDGILSDPFLLNFHGPLSFSVYMTSTVEAGSSSSVRINKSNIVHIPCSRH